MPQQCRPNKRFEITQSQSNKVPLRTFNHSFKKGVHLRPFQQNLKMVSKNKSSWPA
jgi:hypothetical protein